MLLTNNTLSDKPIILVYGSEGTGKTHFILSAPGPIAISGWDRKPEMFWKPYISKGISYEHYAAFKQECPLKGESQDGMILNIKTTNSATLERFFQTYLADLKSQQSASVVIDNITKINACNKLASFGRVGNIMPTNYGELRSTMTRIFDMASSHEKVVIVTSEESELYVRSTATGRMKPDGVNTILRMTRDTYGFKATFEKCSLNYNLYGEELEDEDISYANVLALIKG
jgi:hypothetical protein